jgi:hypothetical protein
MEARFLTLLPRSGLGRSILMTCTQFSTRGSAANSLHNSSQRAPSITTECVTSFGNGYTNLVGFPQRQRANEAIRREFPPEDSAA